MSNKTTETSKSGFKQEIGLFGGVSMLGSIIIGGGIVIVGMTISQLGSINGMAIAFPRTYYAMAAEGHFFKSFAKLHPKYRVPTAPILCQCLITIVLI